MVKFLGKKVLATLLVLSLVVTLTPFAFAETANSTTSVTKYSDLGLDKLTASFSLDVDNDTDLETKPTAGNDVSLLQASADSGYASFMSSTTRHLYWNYKSGSELTRINDAWATIDEKSDNGNMVAVIKGGSYNSIDASNVSRSISVGKGTSLSSLGQYRIYEIKVKFKNVNDGDYRFFGMHNKFNMSENTAPNNYCVPIAVNNGKVLTYKADKYPGNDASGVALLENYECVVADNLKNDTWYTFVRVTRMNESPAVDEDGDGTVGTMHWEGKTYVFEGNKCIGGHDDLRDFATLTSKYGAATTEAGYAHYRAIGFAAKGLSADNEVMFDDFKAYSLAAPSVTCEADTDNDTAITVTDTTKPLTFTPNNFKFVSGAIDNITLTTGGEVIEDVATLTANGTVEVDLSGLPANTYELKFDNVTNPVGDSINKTYTITIQSPTFSIGDVEFVGENGVTTVDTIAAGTKVRAKVTMTNSGEDQDFVIILALYKDNQLKQVIFKDDEPATEGTNSYMTNALTAESDGMTACIYVWDSWDNLQPFIDATPLE